MIDLELEAIGTPHISKCMLFVLFLYQLHYRDMEDIICLDTCKQKRR